MNHQRPKSDRPIFIVGSPRSGTSILVASLRSGAGIIGRTEGHFLPLLGSLLNELEDYYGSKWELRKMPDYLLTQLPSDLMASRLVRLFQEIYAEQHDDEVWLDKTADVVPIRMCPTAFEAWPGARFIYAKRRGIENIASRMRKFPHVTFENHCQSWADAATMWLRVRPLLGDRFLEVEQRDIALDPRGVAHSLQKFLGLTDEQGLGVAQVLKNERPEQSASPRESTPTTLAETGWTDEQIETFRGSCGEVMTALGYGESSYYLSDAEHDSPPSTDCVRPDSNPKFWPFKNAAEARSVGNYPGNVDRCDSDAISGWVQDRRRPQERLSVEFIIDGVIVATSTADGFRPDLRAAGIGDGKYAFSWIVPPELKDGRPHRVAVRIAGTSLLVDGSAQSVLL